MHCFENNYFINIIKKHNVCLPSVTMDTNQNEANGNDATNTSGTITER